MIRFGGYECAAAMTYLHETHRLKSSDGFTDCRCADTIPVRECALGWKFRATRQGAVKDLIPEIIEYLLGDAAAFD